eukprot:13862256-Alexandrium_andersonii.AAC.1
MEGPVLASPDAGAPGLAHAPRVPVRRRPQAREGQGSVGVASIVGRRVQHPGAPVHLYEGTDLPGNGGL